MRVSTVRPGVSAGYSPARDAGEQPFPSLSSEYLLLSEDSDRQERSCAKVGEELMPSQDRINSKLLLDDQEPQTSPVQYTVEQRKTVGGSMSKHHPRGETESRHETETPEDQLREARQRHTHTPLDTRIRLFSRPIHSSSFSSFSDKAPHRLFPSSKIPFRSSFSCPGTTLGCRVDRLCLRVRCCASERTRRRDNPVPSERNERHGVQENVFGGRGHCKSRLDENRERGEVVMRRVKREKVGGRERGDE
jgi:hypothetical protein